MDNEALAFLSRAGNDGRIVSSNDLTELQIAEARAHRRFYVCPDGFGYALLPWDLTTTKDVQRQKMLEQRQ